MGRSEARALGIPWATVTRWKRRVRGGLPPADGHGGPALDRFRFTILSGKAGQVGLDWKGPPPAKPLD